MATQVVYLASSVSGSAQNPNNALGNTPSTWAGITNANTSWTHRWAFTNPTENTLTGTQSLTVTVRKGSNSNNPTLSSINVYQGGTLVAQDSASKSISSTTGQTFTVNWVGSGSSADVHLELVTSSAGGSPSARNAIEFSHSAWTAQTPDPNLAPVANAGANQNVNVNTLVTLNGSASSDPEGQTLTYNWQQTAGPPVTLSGEGATRTFTPQFVGTYTFSLSVSDGAVWSNPSYTSVAVSNAKPEIDDPFVTEPSGGWVAGSGLSGMVSIVSFDSERQPLTYSFAIISGRQDGLVIESGVPQPFQATITPIIAGNYVIRATVTDLGGASSSHDFYITVLAPYTLPSIDLYVTPIHPATTIFAGEEFYIDATSARQWLGYEEVTFIEVYGPSMLTWTDVTSNDATAIASVPGEYSLTASITDARGNTASSNAVFIVQDANATVTQWYVVQAGVEVAMPPFEGIVENGAITPGTMGET